MLRIYLGNIIIRYCSDIIIYILYIYIYIIYNIIIRYCIDICGPVVSWENHPWWSGHYGLKSAKKLSKKFNFKIFHINFRFLIKINTPKNTLKQTQNLKCFTYRFIWIFFLLSEWFLLYRFGSRSSWMLLRIQNPDPQFNVCGSTIRS